ncbi:thioredoxin reductase, putative [Eimeria maxima]|uniref:Thioredoxin reductase, putative n=1 Tax=Eimeria maxima TaxID=5804 RepID=U6M2H1_EIMMA|nr:thioredoxin reductase, putative [Eimeria maxima]CDJ56614.1 thioredoxin reductase, putative [Eimeria maxima]
MRLDYVPTTVFTPIEYGCVGLSEEAAISKYGEEDIEVYLREFSPLEFSACHRERIIIRKEEEKGEKGGKKEEEEEEEINKELSPCCLSKLICLKSKNLKVLGIHFVGPEAAEVIQGMALAIQLGATKADFDNTLGIHPSNAECFMQLQITKRSGENWVATGGCGGGKCG